MAIESNEIVDFIEPHIILEVNSYKEEIEVEKFSSDYIKLKEEAKIRNKEEWKMRYQN